MTDKNARFAHLMRKNPPSPHAGPIYQRRAVAFRNDARDLENSFKQRPGDPLGAFMRGTLSLISGRGRRRARFSELINFQDPEDRTLHTLGVAHRLMESIEEITCEHREVHSLDRLSDALSGKGEPSTGSIVRNCLGYDVDIAEFQAAGAQLGRLAVGVNGESRSLATGAYSRFVRLLMLDMNRHFTAENAEKVLCFRFNEDEPTLYSYWYDAKSLRLNSVIAD